MFQEGILASLTGLDLFLEGLEGVEDSLTMCRRAILLHLFKITGLQLIQGGFKICIEGPLLVQVGIANTSDVERKRRESFQFLFVNAALRGDRFSRQLNGLEKSRPDPAIQIVVPVFQGGVEIAAIGFDRLLVLILALGEAEGGLVAQGDPPRWRGGRGGGRGGRGGGKFST